MAEQVGFADIDTQKEDWMGRGFGCSYHGVVDVRQGRSKRLMAEESQSHQNRFIGSKMLLGLGGLESRVMPYLVHRPCSQTLPL